MSVVHRSLEAKDLALPLARPLVTLLQCARVLTERGPRPVPLVLVRVVALNAAYLADALEKLGRRGEVHDDALDAAVERVRHLAGPHDVIPDAAELDGLAHDVAVVAQRWSKTLKAAAAEHAAQFGERYRDRTGRVRLLLLHAATDAAAASRIARTLRDECWYDVTTQAVGRGPDGVPSEDMRLLYASRPLDLARCFDLKRPAVVLSDIGPSRRPYDLALGRCLARIDATRTPILNRPFLAVRLLGTIEKVRVTRLVALERRVLIQPRHAGESTLRLLRVLRRIYERPVPGPLLDVPAELWAALERTAEAQSTGGREAARRPAS
jgi:hypothetical protein